MHKINQYWKEGKYLDLWSVNHVLSGVVLGSLLLSFGVSLNSSLAVAIILFVGWEIAEIFMGIKEHTPNMVADVVCDLAGFAAVALWFAKVGPIAWTTTAIWILIYIVLNIWGFIAYEARKIDAIPEKLHTHL